MRSPITRARSSRRFGKKAILAKRTLRAEPLEPRLLLSASPLASVISTTLAASADAYVRGGVYAAYNFGNANVISAEDHTNGTYDYQSYLRFDLSRVVGQVESAILKLTPIRLGSGVSSMTLRLRLAPDAGDGWIEGNGGRDNKPTGELTWNNQPGASGAEITISGAQLVRGRPISIDVTSLLTQASNVNGIATILIDTVSPASSLRYVDFASREYLIGSYRPTLTVKANDNNQAPTVAAAASAAPDVVAGTTTALSVLGDDDGGESGLSYRWSATALPGGAAAPTFSVNASNAAKNTVATFSKAGTYTLTATIADARGLSIASSVTVVVDQSFTSVALTPASVSLLPSATQQFAAAGLDQFGYALAVQPVFTWSASDGTISDAGLFTAPGVSGSVVVTASSGSLSGQANVNVTGFLGLQDAALAGLVQSLYVDGSINRLDMIQILRSTGSDDGLIDSIELGDLKTVLTNAATLNIASYVGILAGDIVYGNVANAHFQGQLLGNLVAGSSAATLNKLVDKWFLGADHPAAGTYTYRTVAGSLFVGGPAYTDMRQGNLGDCYLIASLGSLAKSSTASIGNMFIDNGDGTWTVRFYANGVADYVTVDRMLPTNSSGYLVYASARGTGSSHYTTTTNELWIPLAEKAYAQWNETGKEGRNGTNTYAALAGGWMYVVDAQVLGRSAQTYWWFNDSYKPALIDALATNKAVTIGTKSNPGNGLYGPHAYVVTGYNSATDTFTLYNPWGSSHPAPLSWAQLKTSCQCFVVADTSGSVPAAKGALGSSLVVSPIVAVNDRSLADAAVLNTRTTTGDDAARREALASQESRPTDSRASLQVDASGSTTSFTFFAIDRGKGGLARMSRTAKLPPTFSPAAVDCVLGQHDSFRG